MPNRSQPRTPRRPPTVAPPKTAAALSPLRLLYELVDRAVRQSAADGIVNWAAAIAYYSLLSLFPLVLATLSVAAHFVDAGAAIREITRFLGIVLPEGSQFVRETVQEVYEQRGAATALSALMLLWAGGGAFRALSTALNAMYGYPVRYAFWRSWLQDAATSLVMGSLLALALSVGFLLDVLAEALSFLPHHGHLVLRLIDSVTPPILLLAAYYATYRFMPRKRIDRRSALSGAGLAVALFLAARPVFGLYVRQFARWNLVYGPLAIVIGLLFWAWVVAIITLFGGEFAAQVEGWLAGTAHHESSNHLRATPTPAENRK